MEASPLCPAPSSGKDAEVWGWMVKRSDVAQEAGGIEGNGASGPAGVPEPPESHSLDRRSATAGSLGPAVGLLAILRLIVARSVREWRLLSVSVLGLAVAVGLAAAVPLYSYGALDRLLQTRLASLINLPPNVVLVRSSLGE